MTMTTARQRAKTSQASSTTVTTSTLIVLQKISSSTINDSQPQPHEVHQHPFSWVNGGRKTGGCRSSGEHVLRVVAGRRRCGQSSPLKVAGLVTVGGLMISFISLLLAGGYLIFLPSPLGLSQELSQDSVFVGDLSAQARRKTSSQNPNHRSNLQQQENQGNWTGWGAAFRRVSSRAQGSHKNKKDNSIPVSTNPTLEDKNSNPYHFQTHSWDAPPCKPILDPAAISYTLVTQSSESRLWMMQHHCQKWPHEISIAIGAEIKDHNSNDGNNNHRMNMDSLHHNENSQSLPYPATQFMRQLQAMGCDPLKLSVAVVPISTTSKVTESGHTTTTKTMAEYPVNRLRNQALAQVRTTHAVYIDIDFWPSPNLYGILNQPIIRKHFVTSQVNTNITNDEDSHEDVDKSALVIPAFQIRRQCRQYKDCRKQNIHFMPTTRQDLMEKIKKHQAVRFDPTNLGGHGSTLYSQWITQSASELLELPCFTSDRYEPYLVFRYCRNVPPFQETFSGYGKNKMTWIMHLRRLGWRFWQLGGSALCRSLSSFGQSHTIAMEWWCSWRAIASTQ